MMEFVGTPIVYCLLKVQDVSVATDLTKECRIQLRIKVQCWLTHRSYRGCRLYLLHIKKFSHELSDASALLPLRHRERKVHRDRSSHRCTRAVCRCRPCHGRSRAPRSARPWSPTCSRRCSWPAWLLCRSDLCVRRLFGYVLLGSVHAR